MTTERSIDDPGGAMFDAADTYETPASQRRDLADRLCLGGGAWFYTLLAREVLWSRRQALRGLYDDRAWAASSRRILNLLERCGARVRVEGLDHVRSLTGPVVFIGNHMSTAETMVLPCLIAPFRPVTFVVKDSLTRMPIFGPVMRSRNPITVGRVNPRQDMQAVLGDGAERLAAGTSIILFPQSTRQLRFDPGRFNTLGIKLARRAGVPVVPLALRTDFWQPGRLVKEFGPLDRSRPVRFRFGAPRLVGDDQRAAHQAVITFIVDSLHEWGSEPVTASD
jgi:1-acyl-sn-glycerol-3-phosphate acyltransferase